MKKQILPILALTTCTLANAQTKTFAFTSESKGGYQWTALRQIDVAKGVFTEDVLTAKTQKTIAIISDENAAKRMTVNNPYSVTGSGVAAAAYDKQHNRLYFSEMFGNQLKYMDLNTSDLTIHVLTDSKYSTGTKAGENNVVTRMAFAADGTGYALTNDGNNFIKFTTGENPVITNLGTIKDSRKNTNISVHTQCTSWGGDIIGDVYGNLYLITMRNHVFKINVSTTEAEYIGQIKNLPAEFTTNGAVADEDGNILVASASNSTNYYKVNPATLESQPIAVKNELYNVSDLANANLVYQSKGTSIAQNPQVVTNDIAVFPNPVTNKTVNIQFNKSLAGNYSIAITDANGKAVQNKQVNLNGEANQALMLNRSITPGLYMIKIVDAKGNAVHNSKLMVQ